MEINTITDFRRWVKMNLGMREMTQASLAKKMKIQKTRICEALYDKPQGQRYKVLLIEEFGGNVEDFKAIL